MTGPSGGYIKIFRSLADHALWHHGRFSWAQAWIDLLFEAAWKDTRVLWGFRWINVKRGQLLTTQVRLAERWHWERKAVKSFLEALKADSMTDTVTVSAGDTPYTLITICNYDRFQSEPEEPWDTATDTRRDTLGTRSAQKNGLGDGHGETPDKPLVSQHLTQTENQGMGHGNGHPTATAADTKVKNRRSNKKPSVFWCDFFQTFSAENQEVLAGVLNAITSTRKSGRIAESVQNAIAGKLSSYPQSAVLAGCKTYLQKDCAAEGKDERYLVGIVRRLSSNGSHSIQPAKTQGQLAIEAAERERLREQSAEAGR